MPTDDYLRRRPHHDAVYNYEDDLPPEDPIAPARGLLLGLLLFGAPALTAFCLVVNLPWHALIVAISGAYLIRKLWNAGENL